MGANLGCETCKRKYHFSCGYIRGVDMVYTSTASKSVCWECKTFFKNETGNPLITKLFTWDAETEQKEVTRAAPTEKLRKDKVKQHKEHAAQQIWNRRITIDQAPQHTSAAPRIRQLSPLPDQPRQFQNPRITIATDHPPAHTHASVAQTEENNQHSYGGARPKIQPPSKLPLPNKTQHVDQVDYHRRRMVQEMEENSDQSISDVWPKVRLTPIALSKKDVEQLRAYHDQSEHIVEPTAPHSRQVQKQGLLSASANMETSQEDEEEGATCGQRSDDGKFNFPFFFLANYI